MLQVLDRLPDGLLACGATELAAVLGGPTLIHLAGRRTPPLFVSVLLHGDEDTGWLAVRQLLRETANELPRALSLFIGNVRAAGERRRYLLDQPDYNRIWSTAATPSPSPEQAMTQAVIAQMQQRGVFASVDIHNNTGLNPHYACVRRLDPPFLQLAALFGRTVVHFTKPDGVQAEAFAHLCPAVTVECGQPGRPYGVEHAAEYVHACLQLAEIPRQAVAAHDIDLYHSIAIVKVRPDIRFGFDGDDAVDLCLAPDLDRLNFRELPTDTVLGRVNKRNETPLIVIDASGRDATDRFLRIYNNEIRTILPVTPAMFTVNPRAVRLDCLGYFMQPPRASP